MRKWGDIDITEDMSYNNNVAKLNPFRYRGYYYDTETGLIHLHTVKVYMFTKRGL